MNNQAENVVIVGAGHAGGALAGFLRQYGFQGPITLLGAESTPPYQRPPLSKAWLKDQTDTQALHLKAPEWYEENRVSLRLQSEVRSIDKLARTVLLTTGEAIAYDQLVFATGASARRLATPGADLEGVTYLRDLADAATIKTRLRSARRLAVIGGGYIGLEVAATARHFGVEVVVLERAQRLLSRSASAQVANYLHAHHSAQGVEFSFGVEIEEIAGTDGHVDGVRLAGGTTIACDMVLVGIGASPNSDLAHSLDVSCENGIRVDSEGRTSVAHVWAIGDVTSRPLAHFQGHFRLESVPSALEQAKRVACAIAGRELPVHELPWFWSDQFGTKLQIAGMPGVSDETVVRGDFDSGKFSVFHLRQGALCAAECVNSPGDFLASKKAIAAGARPDFELLVDPAARLVDAFSRPAKETAAAVSLI